MKKQSIYNIWVADILYNSLSDQLIQFKNNELESVKYFLDHLDEFETDYPEIFVKFESKGFIIESDFNEIEYILFNNRKTTLLDRHYRLTINPTLDCNYNCWYCCVEEAGAKYERRRMDDETVQKVRNHIQYVIEKERINCFYFDWFGGEPLMYFYEIVYPLSKYGIELCKEKKVPCSNHITTNAYYIDDSMIEAFKEIRVNSFQIPIDGHEKKHNSVKKMANIGHYRKIIKNINALCERIDNVNIILRINYDENTLKTILPLIDDIKFENRNKISVDFQRVWQVKINKDVSGNNSLLLETIRIFENSGFKTIYFAFSPKGFACCYADNFYHRVINYDGKVFKCTARDYSDDSVIGTLNTNGSIDFKQDVIIKMFDNPTFNNEKCLKCNKLPLCYGPCIQKYYDTKIGKSRFFCLYDGSEISIDEYIKGKALKQMNSLYS